MISYVLALDQVCSVPAQLASESVRVWQDTLDHASREGFGCVLIPLDEEKALDRLDWSFIQPVLIEKFTFGKIYQKISKYLTVVQRSLNITVQSSTNQHHMIRIDFLSLEVTF